MKRLTGEILPGWNAVVHGSRAIETARRHPDWTRVPLAVALIADPAKGGPHIHGEATYVIGGGLAAQNMWLMAHALGLGATLVTH